LPYSAWAEPAEAFSDIFKDESTFLQHPAPDWTAPNPETTFTAASSKAASPIKDPWFLILLCSLNPMEHKR
jgi:hypothetical protein